MSTQFFLDLDGTLTDISTRHYGVYVECVNELNGMPISKDEYWQLKRSDTKWGTLLIMSGISSDNEFEFLKKFIAKIETLKWLRIDTLLPGVLDTIDKLSKNYTLVLVSLRRNREELLSQLRYLSIDHYFADILSGHSETKEGTLLKKAEVIRQHGYSKGSVIVGDTEADVAAGEQLGIRSFAVLTGIRDETFLNKYNPSQVITALPEVLKLL